MEGHEHTNIENIKGVDNLTFDRNKATVLLDVVPSEASFLSVCATALREGLSQKTEFHITIIGRQTGEMILKKVALLPPQEKADFLTSLERLCMSYDWIYQFSTEFYLITKNYSEVKSEVAETRTSIIQALDMPDLTRFYEQLQVVLGSELPVPFPHVTLYTTSTNAKNTLLGIGIYSDVELQTLQPIQIAAV